MVEDIDPHIIGITESWATDISDAELGLTGYVMFRKDRIGRRGVEVFILNIKKKMRGANLGKCVLMLMAVLTTIKATHHQQ